MLSDAFSGEWNSLRRCNMLISVFFASVIAADSAQLRGDQQAQNIATGLRWLPEEGVRPRISARYASEG
jgi:hypothetical protein